MDITSKYAVFLSSTLTATKTKKQRGRNAAFVSQSFTNKNIVRNEKEKLGNSCDFPTTGDFGPFDLAPRETISATRCKFVDGQEVNRVSLSNSYKQITFANFELYFFRKNVVHIKIQKLPIKMHAFVFFFYLLHLTERHKRRDLIHLLLYHCKMFQW